MTVISSIRLDVVLVVPNFVHLGSVLPLQGAAVLGSALLALQLVQSSAATSSKSLSRSGPMVALSGRLRLKMLSLACEVTYLELSASLRFSACLDVLPSVLIELGLSTSTSSQSWLYVEPFAPATDVGCLGISTPVRTAAYMETLPPALGTAKPDSVAATADSISLGSAILSKSHLQIGLVVLVLESTHFSFLVTIQSVGYFGLVVLMCRMLRVGLIIPFPNHAVSGMMTLTKSTL